MLATKAASGLFPSLTFLVTSAWHRSPLILSFSSFVSNDMVQLICEPRKDASAPCYFAWTRINVKMRFHLLFPLFFVTTCRSLEQFSRTKKSRVRRNSWHYRSAKSPSFTWARVQFQHRLKCIVEIGQDFIDILQRRNKKFKVSRGLSFNLPVIDEKLP